jgi:hypothetical protein
MSTGIGIGNGIGLLGGYYSNGGDLINTHSLEVNGFRFTNTGISGYSNPLTMTYSQWVKIPSGAGSVLLWTQTINPNVASSGYIRLANAGGIWYFSAYTNEDPPPPGGQTLWRDRRTSGATDYRDDTWHHVMVTMDAYGDAPETQMFIYIDGVDVSTNNLSEGDTIRPTVWSMDSSRPTTHGHTSAVSGALIAQSALFDYLPAASTLYNSGAVFDLNSLAIGPVEWYQFAEDISNSGSSGVDGTASAGTASYSTDTPPE